MSNHDFKPWFRGFNGPFGSRFFWPIHWKGVLFLAANFGVAAASLAATTAGIVSAPLLLLMEAVPAYFVVRVFFDHLDWIESSPRRLRKNDLRNR